jgi:bifunctional non-homologous end joining protein LigD
LTREGSADVLRDEPDHVSVVLHGQKLAGRFDLTNTGDQRWLLVKANDDHARPGSDVVAAAPASVRTGRTWQQVAAGL